MSFISPEANYHYMVMLFGLKNIGATYQRMMTRMFREKINHTVEVYIDDMVVKSKKKKKSRGMLATSQIYLKYSNNTSCISMPTSMPLVWGLVSSLAT